VSWSLLIVEDDDDIRDGLASIFAARGLRPYIAGNGAEAVQVATSRAVKPAVILLDLVMPIMDGLEFLTHQAEFPLLAGVPVIVITAQGHLARELPSTVQAVLEKPIPLRQLVTMVQEICSSVVRSGMPAPTVAKGSGGMAALEPAPPAADSPSSDDQD